ncbi:hypothetical protein IAT40_007808 [Kwoniella sp. CBS 6097]
MEGNTNISTKTLPKPIPVPTNRDSPGSKHTRSSSTASNRPAAGGHARTPSADHLIVPARLDTAPQRKRQESLDTLGRQTHAHSLATPTPLRLQTQTQAPIRPPSREHSHPLPARKQSRELPRTLKPRSHTLPAPTAETREERHSRMRKLSSREMLYPNPDAAKQAFQAQRAAHPPPSHRRPPTPHTSFRRASRSIKKVDSDHSIRSRVSFDSTRSRRSDNSNRSRRSQKTDDSGGSDDETIGDDWEPHFRMNTSVGPAGEAIEVIGLGRKTPRHRTFNTGLLKPALRSTSRVNSRVNLREDGGMTPTPERNGKREKPLPSRPMSYVASIGGTFSRLAPSSHKRNRHASHQPNPSSSSYQDESLLGASASVLSRSGSRATQHSQNANPAGLRSLFSSLSIGNGNHNRHETTSSFDNSNNNSSRLGSSQDLHQPSSIAPSRASRRHPIVPADDLYLYLKLAEVCSWDRWPIPTAPGQGKRGIWGGRTSLSFDELGWEWHRRLSAAEEARMAGRMLGTWENAGRSWERGVLDFQQENVPSHPIDPANRWGTQIFALPAEGFDTLEFFDEAIFHAEDLGLLSWITGTLLQTAVSTLHMLRYSSQTFTFHLIPAPRPPHLHHSSSSLSYDSPNHSHGSRPHYLWEGFGTMVLVNKSNDVDRAMVLEIRPPSVVDSSAMKEFARGKGGEGWWAFYGETCVGDVGQANLLQAQVYDSCIQNQVFFFAVTNLKYWVFGQFNSNYTRCTVSPVIDRRGRDPSLMQCLTAWVVRAVDERPRGTDPLQAHSHTSSLATPPQDSSQEQDRDRDRRHRRPSHGHIHGHSHSHTQSRDESPYSEGMRSRHNRTGSRSSFSLPPNPQGYDYPFPHPQPNGTSTGPTPVYPISTPNGTQTVFPITMPMNPNHNNNHNHNHNYNHNHNHNHDHMMQPEYGNYGLPSYNDISMTMTSPVGSSMSPGPYAQPGHGHAMNQLGMNMNYGGGWAAPSSNIGGVASSSRAFSPTPTHAPTPVPGHGHGHGGMPYNFGTSWYGGGGMFSWPGMR